MFAEFADPPGRARQDWTKRISVNEDLGKLGALELERCAVLEVIHH